MEMSPCKDCNEHKEACHSNCQAYISWQKRWQASKESKKDYENRISFGSYIYNARLKIEKRKGNKR